MIGRWFYSRLRAAERALAEGRIDDAYATAGEPEVARHGRGQALRDALVRPLIARARLHRQAGRYADALADLDRLVAIDRNTPEVQDLRQRWAAEAQAGRADAAERRDAEARAAELLRAGRLETGRLDVQRIDDTQQRARLAEELEHRVQRSTELIAQAAAALDREDLMAAIRFWNDARKRFGHTHEADALATRLARACRQTLGQWHREGRIERLLAVRGEVGALVAHDPTLTEFERLVALASAAAEQLGREDYDGLRRTLLRVKAAAGEAPWLAAALDALGRISEGREVLMASPLGLYSSQVESAGPASEVARDGGRVRSSPRLDARAAGRVDGPAARLSRPLLLIVDGGGSNVIVGGDLVRLGRAGGSSRVDVPFAADVQSHHADIVRRGEEYFLCAYAPVQVNRRPVEHVRLRDGDRVQLGEHVRFVFHRPSPMSASAVLRLSHRCRLPQDVSSVVLFQDTCLIGPDAGCHVRTNGASGRMVVFARGETLQGRATGGSPQETALARPLALGQTQDFGELRVTLTSYGASGSATG